MARYLLTRVAEDDLRSIKDYIARERPQTARRVIRELRQAMRGLADLPGKGHSREDLTGENVRFWKVYSYLIVYRPETKPLEIISVLSGWRDIRTVLKARGI